MPCAVPRAAARPTGARSRRGWRAPRSNPPRFQVAPGRRRARGEWLPLRQGARGPASHRLAPLRARGGPRDRGFRGTALPPPPAGRPHRSEEHTSELQSRLHLVCRIIRSEEHTSELQSRLHLVCRLLLEKKNRYESQSAQYVVLRLKLRERARMHAAGLDARELDFLRTI